MAGRRRWRIAAGLGLAVAVFVALPAAFVGWLVGTDAGRARALAFGLDAATGLFEGRGRVTAGRLRSLHPDRILLEDVRLLDSTGVPILRVAQVRGSLALRDLTRGLVRIPRLELDSLRLDLRQDSSGPFNLQWLLAGAPRDTAPARVGRRLGDDVRVEALVLRHGEVDVRYPWEPHPLFVTPAERDSVVALRDSLHDLTRTARGFVERRRIAIAEVRAHALQLITPDDSPGSVTIDRAVFAVSDPPLRLQDLRGVVRWYDDSLTVAAPDVRLPRSRLAARGVLSWVDSGPVRYDVALDAPDVALADVHWTWPVLPPEGRASGRVRLRTLADPDHLEVTLEDLEASAMASRVTGRLTMVAEVRDFLLRDVALAFDPLTTALAARLTEDALPPDVEGQFTGRFVARDGGSLDALRIDTLQVAFEDARAPGARSRLRASGTVAVGATPAATDVTVAELVVDLRSVRALVPDLPPIVNGSVRGSARIASASRDAAVVRGLTLRWTDEAGNASRVGGRAAVRWAGGTPRADVALAFDTVALAALARLDTEVRLRGPLTGALEANGPLDSLPFAVRLARAAADGGAVRVVGWAGVRRAARGSPDRDSQSWRAALTVAADTLDLAPWLEARTAPSTRLVGSLGLAAAGRGAAVDTVRAEVALAQLASPRHTPFSLAGLGTWGGEALRVDSLQAEAPGIRAEASGALARDSTGRESFRASVRLDSLSELRRELPRLAEMIAQVDTTLAATMRGYAADSLSGDLNVSLYGEGSFARYLVSVAVAGNQVRVGDVVAGRVFGSTRADDLPGAARFVAAATADSVEGIAAIRIATANIRVDDASPASGALRFDLFARDASRLGLRGRFARGDDTLLVRVDSLRFTYRDVEWANGTPLMLRNRPDGFTLDTVRLASTHGGSLLVGAVVPRTDPIHAFLRLDAFPAGELAAFALGTGRLPGLLSGAVELGGTRGDPSLRARLVADSLGTAAATLGGVRLEAEYVSERLDARVVLADTAGRMLRGELTLPADLRLQPVIGDRIYTEALQGRLMADSLRLRDLPLRVAGVRDVDGLLHGRIDLGGTFDQPSLDGTIVLEDGTLYSELLGIRPRDARLTFVAGGDSLHSRLHLRSGPRASDTLRLTATVRRPLRDDPAIALRAVMDNLQLARRADGTEVDLSGTVRLGGRLPRPTVAADLFVPRANLVLDLTESRTVLDLGSPEAQALLAPDERPIVRTRGVSFGSLGEYLEAQGVRVRLGDGVWVRTREAAVKLAGEVTVLETAGRQLTVDGEVEAERGTYRLDLGVVNRPFTVESGRVRFFPQDVLNPVLDIHARHVVRGVDGRDVGIDVAIGGTLERPSVALGTQDDAYANAPESELISLLVFGAPTFALDGERQRTVRAVTGALLPSLSGRVEGTLQRLLPVFNTVQVSTAGGQSGAELRSVASFLGNLSVTAGKQIGRNTYLRLDTGVCRGLANSASGGSLNLWYGVAVERRIAPGLTGQVGVDPGPSPCGAGLGGSAPRMQVGFDLFKAWIF